MLLTGLNLLNYLDRMVLAAVLGKVEPELHLTHFVSGVLATVFLLGYFLTSPFFGALADRGKRKGLIALGVAIWSIATVATGFAVGQWSLLAVRALVGVGEASYATIAPTIIDDIAPAQKKGRWLAIFFAASPIGSALGYVVGGFATHIGWRACFFVAGGPGLLLAALCLLIVEPERRATAEPSAHGSFVQTWESAKRLLPIRLYRRGVLGYAAYTFAIGAFAYWAPTFLHVRYRLELDRANFIFGPLTVVAGAIGTVVGGALGDRAAKKAQAANEATDDFAALGYLRFSAVTCAIGAPLALVAFFAPTATAFFVVVFFCEIFLFLSTSPINAAFLRSVPPSLRASAMAVAIFGIHLLGDLWSPPFVGKLADLMPIQIAMLPLPFAFGIAAALWWVTKRRAEVTA